MQYGYSIWFFYCGRFYVHTSFLWLRIVSLQAAASNVNSNKFDEVIFFSIRIWFFYLTWLSLIFSHSVEKERTDRKNSYVFLCYFTSGYAARNNIRVYCMKKKYNIAYIFIYFFFIFWQIYVLGIMCLFIICNSWASFLKCLLCMCVSNFCEPVNKIAAHILG